jgi:hypothetical protein
MTNAQLARDAEIREWLNMRRGNLLARIQRNDPNTAKSLATVVEQSANRDR